MRRPRSAHAAPTRQRDAAHAVADSRGTDATTPPASAAPDRRRDYLDGVRGLAAFYVVLHHAWLLSAVRFPIAAEAGIAGLLTNWLLYGHLAVDVFIVLSGFCLILPVAASDDTKPYAAANFYARRARRILPPYFAALVVSVLLFFAHDAGASGSGDFWRGVGLHAMLLQDFFNVYAPFNPPLWTIAVETHIYLLFPLFVGALRTLTPNRRYAVVLLGTAILGYGIVRLYLQIVPNAAVADLGHACPWYVFLFAMGVCAGHLAATMRTDTRQKPRRVATVLLNISLLGLFVLLYAFAWRNEEADFARAYPIVDGVAGLVTATALYLLHTNPNPNAAALRLLSAKPLVFVGQFAYSLYLLHFPILLLVQKLLLPHFFPEGDRLTRFTPMLLIGVPLAVALCYVFYLACERPFLRRNAPPPQTGGNTTEDKAAP